MPLRFFVRLGELKTLAFGTLPFGQRRQDCRVPSLKAYFAGWVFVVGCFAAFAVATLSGWATAGAVFVCVDSFVWVVSIFCFANVVCVGWVVFGSLCCLVERGVESVSLVWE